MAETWSFNERIVPSPDVMVRTVGDESIILNLKTQLYLGLDAVGSRMWNAFTVSPSIEEAYLSLLEEYEVAADELRRDVIDFVSKLLEYQLIELQPGASSATQPSP